jgi:hypothetical protein
MHPGDAGDIVFLGFVFKDLHKPLCNRDFVHYSRNSSAMVISPS